MLIDPSMFKDVIYPIIDLLIKVSTGIFIVYFLHKKSRRHVLQDKMQSVYSELVDEYHRLYSLVYLEAKYELYSSISKYTSSLNKDTCKDFIFKKLKQEIIDDLDLYDISIEDKIDFFKLKAQCMNKLYKIDNQYYFLLGEKAYKKNLNGFIKYLYKFKSLNLHRNIEAERKIFDKYQTPEKVKELCSMFNAGLLTEGEFINKTHDVSFQAINEILESIKIYAKENVNIYINKVRIYISKY